MIWKMLIELVVLCLTTIYLAGPGAFCLAWYRSDKRDLRDGICLLVLWGVLNLGTVWLLFG